MKIDSLKQQISELSTGEKIQIWNEWKGDRDSQIYEFDEEFFKLFYPEADALTIIQKWNFGGNHYSDEYITHDGYANFETLTEFKADATVMDDLDSIAEYILENEADFDHHDFELEDNLPNEVSEAEYWEMLEVLPPYYFEKLDGKKVSGGFAVGEPYSHVDSKDGTKSTFSAYYKKDGKHFSAPNYVYFKYTDEYGDPRWSDTENQEAFSVKSDTKKTGGRVYKKGQALKRDRMWTSEEPHEQAYKSKRKSKIKSHKRDKARQSKEWWELLETGGKTQGYSDRQDESLGMRTGGVTGYRGRDIDKIKVGDIVQYAHPGTDYEAKVVAITPNKTFKGLSKVDIEWFDDGNTRFGMKKGDIQSTALEDLMLSKKRYSKGGKAGEKKGLGGFVAGSLIGGYAGYKIGRARPQKKGFSTEKSIAKKVAKTGKKVVKKGKKLTTDMKKSRARKLATKKK